jgi:hypothetical protein
MLRGKQFRQFSEQVKLELAGDGLGHVLAELPATHTPLNSRREIFRHRNADFASCASMLDFHSHVANDDVRRIRLPATAREAQPLKQGTGWTVLGDLEDNQSFNGTPGVVLQCARCEELAKFSRLMRVERTEKGKRLLHKIIPLLRLDWFGTHEIMLPAVAIRPSTVALKASDTLGARSDRGTGPTRIHLTRQFNLRVNPYYWSA